MNTKQIEYILTLAETGNFNRAAERLFVSQPTMTYQIKAAEDEIGFALFDRSQKGVTLTPAGVQQRIIARGDVQYFNSADHSTTLTNVAAGKGICLAPGFLNDHTGEFAWTRFECEESFQCVLCTHKKDTRSSVKEFVELLQQFYQSASDGL